MPRVTVDFSDVEEFEPLPKGDYPVLIDKMEYREAQESDKYDYINWELVVSEGEHKNRKLFFITSFSPKALWRMKQVFENLGVYDDALEVDYDEDADNMVTEPELIGTPALATVSIRKYEGREQNQVDALTAIDDGSTKKAAPGAKKTPAKKPAAKKAATTRKFK